MLASAAADGDLTDGVMPIADTALLCALAPDRERQRPNSWWLIILGSRAKLNATILKPTPSGGERRILHRLYDWSGADWRKSGPRPCSNITGFIDFEYGMSGKWLELLKEVAADVTRVAILRDATLSAGTGQFGAIQAVAPSFGVELSPVNVSDYEGTERAVAARDSRMAV